MRESKKDKTKIRRIKHAAALKYVPGESSAPKIVAVGKGDIAEQIIKKAKESKVPLYKDEQLAKTLSYLNIGDEIPRELYEVVAEILVFISNMDSQVKEQGS